MGFHCSLPLCSLSIRRLRFSIGRLHALRRITSASRAVDHNETIEAHERQRTEKKCDRMSTKTKSRHVYQPGEIALSCDVRTSRKNGDDAELAALTLLKGDGAFILRSDRTWRFAIVKEVVLNASPPYQLCGAAGREYEAGGHRSLGR